jgi:hypothetical protein
MGWCVRRKKSDAWAAWKSVEHHVFHYNPIDWRTIVG